MIAKDQYIDNDFRKQFALEPIKGPDDTYCPECKEKLNYLEFIDGDTFYFDTPEIDHSRYAVFLMHSNPCDFCDQIIYSPELMIASEKKPSYHLVSDNMHKAEKRDHYWLRWRGRKWEIIHFQDVTKVSYYHKIPGQNFESELQWLDCHMLPNFCNDDYCSPASDIAIRITERFLPALLRANLWKYGGKDLLYKPLTKDEILLQQNQLSPLMDEYYELIDCRNQKTQKRIIEIAKVFDHYLDNRKEPIFDGYDDSDFCMNAGMIAAELGNNDDYPEVHIWGKLY